MYFYLLFSLFHLLFSNMQVGGGGVQSFVAQAGAGMGQSQSASAGSGGTAPPRQRVRARRGQATDPHSIAERVRKQAKIITVIFSASSS